MKTIAFAALILAGLSTQPARSFEDCGTLVEGSTCLLFQSDGAGLYLLDDYGAFEAGDRVEVSGDVMSCVSVCQQEDACIEVASIAECATPPDFETCGTLTQGPVCLLFQPDGSGLLYQLDDSADFEAGQRVHVSGIERLDCESPCPLADGCIRGNLISTCPVPTDEQSFGRAKSGFD